MVRRLQEILVPDYRYIGYRPQKAAFDCPRFLPITLLYSTRSSRRHSTCGSQITKTEEPEEQSIGYRHNQFNETFFSWVPFRTRDAGWTNKVMGSTMAPLCFLASIYQALSMFGSLLATNTYNKCTEKNALSGKYIFSGRCRYVQKRRCVWCTLEDEWWWRYNLGVPQVSKLEAYLVFFSDIYGWTSPFRHRR